MVKEIFILLKKYLIGDVTGQDREQIGKWYNDLDKADARFKNPFVKRRVKDNLWAHIQANTEKPASNLPAIRYWTAAAILLIFSGLLYFQLSKNRYMQPDTEHIALKNDVMPGKDKAYLTFSNGTKIDLGATANGKLAGEAGVKLIKNGDGQLVYQASAGDVAQGKSIYHTVSTPNGGQYHVILPDGTKVWLNAASSITFPVAFSDKERAVKMTGEIYFEVAKVFIKHKRQPFIVSTNKQQVEVLGTHFNINAYPQQQFEKTTLAEGSVRIKPATYFASQVLKPGELALLSNNRISVQQASLENELAWKNGMFRFNNEDIITVMQQLERWYDVQIDYANMPNIHFNGGISRNISLAKVLKMLEITGGFRFEIAGKKVKIVSINQQNIHP